jgi:hypothetical protein
MKLSIHFYPNRDKKNNKTGKTPMYMRITLNREKAEMRLNIELTDTDLLKWDETMMRFADRNMSANAYLNEIDKNFEDFRYHNATKLSNYNAKTVRDLVMGLNAKPTPLISHYQQLSHFAI